MQQDRLERYPSDPERAADRPSVNHISDPRDWHMRTIVTVMFTAVAAVLLLASRLFAQPQTGGMDCMSMMGWPMMLFVGLFWVLLLVLMVLTILLLIKQLRK
jgi:uncharacterized Tic20 family protein